MSHYWNLHLITTIPEPPDPPFALVEPPPPPPVFAVPEFPAPVVVALPPPPKPPVPGVNIFGKPSEEALSRSHQPRHHLKAHRGATRRYRVAQHQGQDRDADH